MSDRRYLAERGHELLSLGYEPVPVRPGGKAPSIKQWQTVEVTPGRIDAWLANGSADAGVGVRTGEVCAIDIDITDGAAVKRVVAWCEQHLGPTHRKQGQAPKVTLVYRRHTPGTKMSSALYNDWEGATHRVEVLGTGQQTVMYGIHPGTGRPYRHSAKVLPPLSELPVVTDDELRSLLQFVDDLAGELCWDRYSDAPGGSAPSNPDWDEDEAALAHLVPRLGVSLDEAAQMLSHLDASDHQTWITVAAALNHEFGAAAFDLFDSWSQSADNYGGTDRYWSFTPSPHDRDPITMRSVRKMAQDQLALAPPSELVSDSDGPRGLEVFAWGDAKQQPDPPHQIVEELLVRGTLSLVSAQPNTGKSALMLDLAAHIASGSAWRGLQVEQGTVLYVAAESPESIRSRILAMARVTGWHAPSLYVTQGTVSLTQPEQRKVFADQVRQFIKDHPDTRAVVLDTFRNATPGLEENDAKDMGAVISFLHTLARRLNVHVTVVHHTTKAGTSYAGSGVFGAVVDTEIRIEVGEKDMEGLINARVVQQRSLTSRGAEYWYEIVGEPTGRTTNFGKPETAPLVDHWTEDRLNTRRMVREQEMEDQVESKRRSDIGMILSTFQTTATSHKERGEIHGRSARWARDAMEAAKGAGLVERKGNLFHLTEEGKRWGENEG